MKEPFPKIEITRKVKKDGAKYFGPYFAGLDVREIVKTITMAFKLRTCNLKITETSMAKENALIIHLGYALHPALKELPKKNTPKK